MVRGKFTVTKITKYQYGSQKVTLSALYDPNLPEDQKYAKATPSGTITMQVDNPPAVEYLEIGKAFYVDFTKVEDKPGEQEKGGDSMEEAQPTRSLADKLFDGSLIQLSAEDSLFDLCDSLEVHWEDWSYDHYDRSLELYGIPPDDRAIVEKLEQVWAAGFNILWLNHTDGFETEYVADGREFRTNRGKPKIPQSNMRDLVASLRAELKQVRRERDTAIEMKDFMVEKAADAKILQQASEAREKRVREALEKLLNWLNDDTLDIMRDTIKMGITFNWSDCQQLREQIELARKALEGE